MSAMTLQGSERGRPLCRDRMGHFSASDILRCLLVYRGRRGVERKDGREGKKNNNDNDNKGEFGTPDVECLARLVLTN